MEIVLLQDIAIIFGLSIIALQLCHFLKIPAIIGFLFTGMLVGPHGLMLIRGVHDVEIMAEIGVVLLLFAIGLEFSFNTLLRLKKFVFIGGTLQVVLTIGATVLLLTLGFDFALNRAIFIGFLLALSSTAIVLKIYQTQSEIDTLHGQAILSILIYQDMIVVLMMLLTPMLAGSGSDFLNSLLVLGGKGLLIIAGLILASKYLVPHLLFQVAKTRNREFFLLTVCGLGLATAWLTSMSGLSLGLGAFLAGLIISESEYSLAALGGITPFRDIFMSFFFVSIGMLLDVGFLANHAAMASMLTLGVIGLKFVLVLLVGILLGLPLLYTIMIAFSLSQVGEFSFVLSKVGFENHFLNGDRYQMFLAVTILTMACTPLLIRLAPGTAKILLRLPLPRVIKKGYSTTRIQPDTSIYGEMANHLIIIGFGLNGRHLASAARKASIPYVVIENNAETVRKEREKGEPILFGDATHEALLHHAGIDKARVAAIAISDPIATRATTEACRKLNPDVYLIVRTRFVNEIEQLTKLGASEVIPEEFETAVEIFARVLHQYLVPEQDISRFINEIRADGYRMFRSLPGPVLTVCDESCQLTDAEIKVLRLEAGSILAGKTIGGMGLRKNYGITLLAVRRRDQSVTNPDADFALEANDVLVCFGPPEKMIAMHRLTSGAGAS